MKGIGIYNDIIIDELIVSDPLILTEINTKCKCNGVYVIAGESGKVIYIGEREAKRGDYAIVRFLDHLVSRKSSIYPNGQPSNNGGGLLWNYFNRGMRLNCFIFFDLNFNAHISEAKLIELKNKNSKEKHVINLSYVK